MSNCFEKDFTFQFKRKTGFMRKMHSIRIPHHYCNNFTNKNFKKLTLPDKKVLVYLHAIDLRDFFLKQSFPLRLVFLSFVRLTSCNILLSLSLSLSLSHCVANTNSWYTDVPSYCRLVISASVRTRR
jgi:hypothetical protein